MAGTIHFVADAGVATVTLESPGKLNAVSVAMWRELRRVFEALAGDDSVRCILLRGGGGNFAAGADLDEFGEVHHDVVSGRRFHLETVVPSLAAVRDARQPVLAAIEGVCAGGGLQIALACDIRIAADSARLGVHGTSYGGYATNLLITQTNRFKAAINISGKVDIISFYTDSPRLGVRNIHAAEKSQDRIGATLWQQPQKYVEHSAVMFADRIKTPLLLMTGGLDHNVPAINTREMYYALRRLGKPVVWVNYVNGGHGVPNTTEAEFTDFHQRILDWYAKYLVPKKATNISGNSGR